LSGFAAAAGFGPPPFQTPLKNLKVYSECLEPEIITDVTEIRTERPANKEKQQDRYGGKKSHTVKLLLLTKRYCTSVNYMRAVCMTIIFTGLFFLLR